MTWLGAAHYPQHGMRQLRLQLRLEARQEAAAAARAAASDGEAGSDSDGGSAADDSEPGHSRHLLMALVWVLAKFGVLEALIERQRRPPPPSHSQASGTSLPPFPKVRAGRLGRCGAQQYSNYNCSELTLLGAATSCGVWCRIPTTCTRQVGALTQHCGGRHGVQSVAQRWTRAQCLRRRRVATMCVVACAVATRLYLTRLRACAG